MNRNVEQNIGLRSPFFLSPIQSGLRIVFFVAYCLMPILPISALILALICSTPFLKLRSLRLSEAAFLAVLFIGLYAYFIMGADEQQPVPLNMVQAMSYVLLYFTIIACLFVVRPNDAKMAIQCLALGAIAFVFILGIQTWIFSPERFVNRYSAIHYSVNRFMVHPISGELMGTTGQINTMALASGYLLFVSDKRLLGTIASLMLLLISLLFANRTGMILSAIYLFFSLLSVMRSPSTRNRFTIIASLLVFGASIFMLLPEDIVEASIAGFSRFSNEGLETERSIVQERGITLLLSGEYPFGGAQIRAGMSPWYHNFFLDAYRVSGIPAMLDFLLMTGLSLRGALRTRSTKIMIIWVASLLILCTTVVLESGIIQYAMAIGIFSYALIAGVRTMDKEHIQRRRLG